MSIITSLPTTVQAGIILLGVLGFLALIRRLQQYRYERNLLPLPPQPSGSLLIGNMAEVIAASKVGQQHLLFNAGPKNMEKYFVSALVRSQNTSSILMSQSKRSLTSHPHKQQSGHAGLCPMSRYATNSMSCYLTLATLAGSTNAKSFTPAWLAYPEQMLVYRFFITRL